LGGGAAQSAGEGVPSTGGANGRPKARRGGGTPPPVGSGGVAALIATRLPTEAKRRVQAQPVGCWPFSLS
jgi:hypothetical protein